MRQQKETATRAETRETEVGRGTGRRARLFCSRRPRPGLATPLAAARAQVQAQRAVRAGRPGRAARVVGPRPAAASAAAEGPRAAGLGEPAGRPAGSGRAAAGAEPAAALPPSKAAGSNTVQGKPVSWTAFLAERYGRRNYRLAVARNCLAAAGLNRQQVANRQTRLGRPPAEQSKENVCIVPRATRARDLLIASFIENHSGTSARHSTGIYSRGVCAPDPCQALPGTPASELAVPPWEGVRRILAAAQAGPEAAACRLEGRQGSSAASAAPGVPLEVQEAASHQEAHQETDRQLAEALPSVEALQAVQAEASYRREEARRTAAAAAGRRQGEVLEAVQAVACLQEAERAATRSFSIGIQQTRNVIFERVVERLWRDRPDCVQRCRRRSASCASITR